MDREADKFEINESQNAMKVLLSADLLLKLLSDSREDSIYLEGDVAAITEELNSLQLKLNEQKELYNGSIASFHKYIKENPRRVDINFVDELIKLAGRMALGFTKLVSILYFFIIGNFNLSLFSLFIIFESLQGFFSSFIRISFLFNPSTVIRKDYYIKFRF